MTIREKRFVLTGDFSQPRENYANKLMILGGRVTQAISQKTNYLVAGENYGPVKMSKAKSFGLKVIDEDTLLSMIAGEEGKEIKIEKIQDIAKEDSEEPLLDKSLWTEKYEPASLDDVLGNKTAKDQLLAFLNSSEPGRGILLHGPPGVGKSLSVKLACKQLNITRIEFNASDVRNKSSLADHIRPFISCGTLSKNKRVLVMDECDGMTGDRGGIAELVQIIKGSRIPIVCICNDRQAVKSLSNVCDEITFRKLETRQILACLREIVKKEKNKVRDSDIIKACILANNDMRYILNSLQGNIGFKKIISKNLFDDIIELFSKKSVKEKLDIFFKDYDLIPLMVFENYLRTEIRKDGTEKHRRKPTAALSLTRFDNSFSCHKISEYFAAAEAVSLSDIYSTKMGSNNWSLLNNYGFFSSVLPTRNLKLSKRVEFAKELGKISKTNKNTRILQSFHFHFLGRNDLCEFYFYNLKILINLYLKNLQKNKIDENIEFLVESKLLKRDCDDVLAMLGLEKEAPTKSKSAMTRAYKKIKRALPYNDDE